MKQPWSKNTDAKKIIVLIGDAPVTEGTEYQAVLLCKEAVKKGFILHSVVVGVLRSDEKPQKPSPKKLRFLMKEYHQGYPEITRAGGGQCIYTQIPGRVEATPKKKSKDKGKGKKDKDKSADQIAPPHTHDDKSRRLVNTVIRSIIPKDYHNRVDPFVSVLMEYAASGEPISDRRPR